MRKLRRLLGSRFFLAGGGLRPSWAPQLFRLPSEIFFLDLRFTLAFTSRILPHVGSLCEVSFCKRSSCFWRCLRCPPLRSLFSFSMVTATSCAAVPGCDGLSQAKCAFFFFFLLELVALFSFMENGLFSPNHSFCCGVVIAGCPSPAISYGCAVRQGSFFGSSFEAPR